MPPKPALIFCAALAVLGLAPAPAQAAPAKAPLPTVLLYPATPGDVAALVDLRTRLRLDSRVQVLTYDPESAAIQRASDETKHPEWLVRAPASDGARMTLARALGASFYAVVSPGRIADTTHVELVETAPAARTFDWTGTNREFGVHALESQVADSISHPAHHDNVADNPPAPIGPVSTAPISTAPLADMATRSTPPLTPDLTASAPVPVASAPVPAVPEAPLPLASSVPVPLQLPAPVAQAVPVTPAAPASGPIRIVLPSLQTASAPPLASVPLPAAPVEVAQVPQPQAAPVVVSAPPVKVAVRSPVTVIPTKPPVQVAALPPRVIPMPLPSLPEPLPQTASPPAPVRVAPAPPIVLKKREPSAEDTTAIQPLLERGDSALDGGDTVSAIALYRQAVNGAPLSVVPRLKLAEAYQKDGLSDRASDEARRALEIAPDSVPVQQFLSDLDQQTGTSVGTLIRVRAALELAPNDPAAHAALADALWNSGDLGGAEAEYKNAQALSPSGSHLADAQLAQLYAAEARYDDCLAILKNSGSGGYALAIGIVKNRSDTLSSTLAASRAAFAAGKSTREQFYDDAKKLSAEAQALSEFVADVVPPAAYKLSHLHRMLSTSLLAQESAALVTFIETNDTQKSDSMAQLEHAAATEMLTAQAAEERLGLWKQQSSAR